MNKEIRRISNFSSLPVLIFVLFMQISAAAVQIGINALERAANITFPLPLVYMIMYIFVYPIGGSLAALIFYKTRSRETGLRLSQTFCRPQMSAGWIARFMIITWGLSLLTSIVTNIVLQTVKSLLHLNISDISFDFGDGIGGFAVSYIALCMFAPFFEEVLFRSAVYRNTEIMGQSFAIVFSAMMFSLMHGNLEQIPYTFVMGLGFAYIFAKTRSLLMPMLLHFITNTTTVMFTSVIDATDAEGIAENIRSGNLASIIPTALYSMLIYGVIIAAIVMGIIELVRAIKRRERLKGSFFPISGAKKAAVFLSAPITIITLAILLLFLVLTTINQIVFN